MKILYIFFLIQINSIPIWSQEYNFTGSPNYLRVGDSIHYDFVIPTISQKFKCFRAYLGFLQFQIS